MLREQGHKTRADTGNSFSERIELVNSGEDFFDRLLCIISNTKSELHLQTYIFENDVAGKEVALALKKAVLRNVKVYVLFDGYGSASLSDYFINDLVANGINVRFFAPFFSMNSIYLGRRLHHKIVVADGETALVGGINIADKYRGTKTMEPWLDYAVQIESANAASYLQELCKMIYLKNNRKSIVTTKNTFHLAKGVSAHIIQNDWLHRKNEIYDAYTNAIQNAKEEITILGSYFFPGRRLSKALKEVSLKGVKVKLILSGVSDVPLARRATNHLYTSLLKCNIELYEWKNSVLHGKVATVDHTWATVGSFNLNHLSSYGSIELNLEIISKEFSKTIATSLNGVIAQCEKITYDTLKARGGFFTTILNWFAYRIVRILFRITTYVPYKRFFKRFQNE
ncbi:phospholipase D-like domain-containing protein [Maribacter arcticus]|uniref:Putative cardiolipin synthase n=1 Tax=Maribacter arcticus TaxID=561365 RepID=A0A1T5CHF7_9FLAO|nr:phospholipase D-like domain-containing protein [Maribacter arcticus]SKB58864.1 putative cardiolipin synthase [Maribacter arcticus]